MSQSAAMIDPPWGNHPANPPEPIPEDETLMQRTRRLLQERTKVQSLPEIYREMKNAGSQINYFWLRKFVAGGVQDPSVNRVEELYTFLAGPLVLDDK